MFNQFFQNFHFFKITKSKKCHFFEENLFHNKRIKKIRRFGEIRDISKKCPHKLVDDVRIIQNLLYLRKNE